MFGTGIVGKWVGTPWGRRPHRWGDNQSAVTHTFPAWQRDVIGTECLVPGAFGRRNGVAGQYWRCWYFPGWYYDEFWPEILRRMRGKPLGPNVWVRDSYWDEDPPTEDYPQFRFRNYDAGLEDYTNLGNAEDAMGYTDGYAMGYSDGYAMGFTAGEKKAKGKKYGKKKYGKGKWQAKDKGK